MHDTSSSSSLDSYLEFDDSELVVKLKELGINRLADLSDEAQLKKHRQWELDLKQGGRHKKRGI